jgi:hypothetical protein
VADGWATIEVKLNKASRPVGSVAGFETYSTDGELWIGGALQRSDGLGLIVSEMTVRRMNRDRGVDANALRRIPVAAIVAEVGARLSGTFSYLIQSDDAAVVEAVTAASETRPRGRPSHPDAHYRRIALEYLRLQGEGVGRGVIIQIAAAEGKPKETVRTWVAEARRRGYLTSIGQGRPGAEPGPELVKFMTERRTETRSSE